MKAALYSLMVTLCCMVLCGCPYESPYGIDDTPQQPIDESLLGKWATMVQRPAPDGTNKQTPVKLIIQPNTDTEYNIAITGYLDELKPYRVIENDTIKGTAFLSLIDNRIFLNASIKGKWYIAEVKRKGNAFDLLTLAEHFTEKYVKNCQQLRDAIRYHYKSRYQPMYDNWFVLRNLQKVK